MKFVKQENFTEERALYNSEEITVSDSVFSDGESPIK